MRAVCRPRLLVMADWVSMSDGHSHLPSQNSFIREQTPLSRRRISCNSLWPEVAAPLRPTTFDNTTKDFFGTSMGRLIEKLILFVVFYDTIYYNIAKFLTQVNNWSCKSVFALYTNLIFFIII